MALRAEVDGALCLVELRGFEPLTSCMPCRFGLLWSERQAAALLPAMALAAGHRRGGPPGTGGSAACRFTRPCRGRPTAPGMLPRFGAVPSNAAKPGCGAQVRGRRQERTPRPDRRADNQGDAGCRRSRPGPLRPEPPGGIPRIVWRAAVPSARPLAPKGAEFRGNGHRNCGHGTASHPPVGGREWR
jgi:hypothetical protein